MCCFPTFYESRRNLINARQPNVNLPVVEEGLPGFSQDYTSRPLSVLI